MSNANWADIVGIDRDPEMGVITRVFGRPPIKGRIPSKEILYQLDGAKSVVSFTIFLSKHTPLIPFLMLFPRSRRKVIDYFTNALRKNLHFLFETISINDLCKSGREIARAIGIKNPCDCDCHVDPGFVWTGNHPTCAPNASREIETVLVLSFLLMYEFDDSYRWPLQDIFSEINIKALNKHPRIELRRVLSLAMSRVTNHEGNRLYMFPKYKVARSLVLFMPPSWLKRLVKVILELDMSKIEMDEDDLSWAQWKEYNFRGRPYTSLVRDGHGFIIDIAGTGKYIPNGRYVIYSLSAINPNG